MNKKTKEQVILLSSIYVSIGLAALIVLVVYPFLWKGMLILSSLALIYSGYLSLLFLICTLTIILISYKLLRVLVGFYRVIKFSSLELKKY